MALFSSFDINASGLTAERFRMDIISQNIANQNTTRTQAGGAYRRKVVVFEEKETQTPFSRVLNTARDNYSGKGVRVSTVKQDTWTDMKLVYDPAHPDADENGYVLYPNVDVVTEMTNLISASRAYEANATAFAASKAIALKGLEMAK